MGSDRRLGIVLGDRYKITSWIAQGAMGVVYRGERIGLGRAVAIKFLVEGSAPAAELRRRFEIEAIAASRVCHPNCVAVIDYGVDGETPFLVMDYVHGRTLRALLESPLSVPRALRMSRQILAGLSHAHEQGIVHRDLKPENVLVWSDDLEEHLQITDFGLAKIDASSTSRRVAIGTPSYMAPEQTLGEPVDARADVYAAGVVMFELLTGQKPFHGDNPFETMRLQREAPVPAFEEVAPERALPAAVEGVIRRALAKRADQRFDSAVELARALDRAVEVTSDDPALELDEMLAAVRLPVWRVGLLITLSISIGVAAFLVH